MNQCSHFHICYDCNKEYTCFSPECMNLPLGRFMLCDRCSYQVWVRTQNIEEIGVCQQKKRCIMNLVIQTSLPQSPALSKTMEEMFLRLKAEGPELTWAQARRYLDLLDAVQSLTVSVLTEEEATQVWSKYADSIKVGASSRFQPNLIDPSLGVPEVFQVQVAPQQKKRQANRRRRSARKNTQRPPP